jgi:hypothetical protein
MLHRSLVPMGAHPHDNSRRLITEIRVVSPRLPRMHVADMQLDKWNHHAQERITDRNRRMGEASGVDDYPIESPATILEAIDYRALMIGLERHEGGPQRRGMGCGRGLRRREWCARIYVARGSRGG